MFKSSSGKPDALEERLRGFLGGHLAEWFTVMELSQEKAISASPADIQRTLAGMERSGRVKSHKKGFGEPWAYQAVSGQDHTV